MAIVLCPYIFFPPKKQQLLTTTSSTFSFTRSTTFTSLTNKPQNSTFYSNCKQSDISEFSVLEPHSIPWDNATIWTSYAFYLLSFHIPLSFGGLSVVAQVSNQPVLDPQTKALSLLVIQILELAFVYLVLTHAEYEPLNLFHDKNKDRNWVLGSALGFGFIVLLVFVTSLLVDQTRPVGEASNQAVVKEILSSGVVSQTSCILAYCIVTPLLEEIIYRGIILTALASQMKWYQAVVISSVIFSAAHFSGEGFLQLFVIGSVLGCSYCWTGSLRSPFFIHSLYNALILLIANIS